MYEYIWIITQGNMDYKRDKLVHTLKVCNAYVVSFVQMYADAEPLSDKYADAKALSVNYADAQTLSEKYADAQPLSVKYADAQTLSEKYADAEVQYL
jgi:hypothetical protein